MRAQFIKGQDPIEAMGLGIDGEVEKANFYKKFSEFTYRPVTLSKEQMHELFSNWKNLINGDYIFRFKEKGEIRAWDASPKSLEGKTIAYDGKIYDIPES
jgi:hypothetical protein